VYGDWLDGGYGTTPPATVTHTFREPGTYTIQFNYSNDAKGTAESSMEVTVVP
jgi:surface-anchored protein